MTVIDQHEARDYDGLFHVTPREQARVDSIVSMLPPGLASVLDVGARGGFISRRVADRVPAVTALDLETPLIDDPRITCVRGDATRLDYPDAHFDMVLCSEVLEHIPGTAMLDACREIARVARRYALIGVPYRQDLRHGRLTCTSCGRAGPAWGHVHSFDEHRLRELFAGLQVLRVELVGVAEPGTNALSTWLMDLAGNPYGPYEQGEGCTLCGASLVPPPTPGLLARVSNRLAAAVRDLHNLARPQQASWIHVLLAKPPH